MAVCCRTFLGAWIILCVLSIFIHVVISERHGLPGKYITVAREKRSTGPVAVNVAGEGGGPSSPFMPHSNHFRRRRDAAEDTHKPEVSVFALNDTHQQVMIQWAGEGSPVIICLTRNSAQDNTSLSNVFISEDNGTTYQNITTKFRTSDGKLAIINTFYSHHLFNSRFVFTDIINKYIHITKDYGKIIGHHKLGFTPTEVTLHPTNGEVLLVHDTNDYERKLWVSENFGTDWRLIGLYVKSYYWSKVTSPPTLYVERGRESGSSVVLSSQELFREETTPTKVIESILQFEVKDEFLFAVRRSVFRSTLFLLVSYRGGRFQLAEFPNNMKHEHYYIADVSEGQIMVCIAHEHFMSNLYVSSVPRSPDHPVKFSLSLERILYFKPSINWENTWLSEVADKQFADLHQVEGIRGVFIASQLMANMTSNTSRLAPEHTISHISFDQGAQWKPLQPPRKDVSGKEIKCDRADNCSLHVSQSLSHLYPATAVTPIMSKKSAPGLILATGTIGQSLKGHTSLYVSVDAGINWFQVLRGNFLYTIGDHGGIIVAVQHFKAAGETKSLYYSMDEGESWEAYEFSSEPLRIYGLMTEPGENTTIFTLFGSRSEKHQWIFIKVDLKPVFKYECSKEDYKTWSPSDGRRGQYCLLGRKQVYERRIPHSNCYNGVDYDRPISTENCPCDREDFECDFGFIVDQTSQVCIKDPDITDDPYTVPSTCTPGSFYNRTKGYRMVPGDSCEGGRDYQYNPTITACPVREEQEFLLVSARQEILRFNLVNPDAGLQRLPIPHLNIVIALDFDMTANCIYWSDINDKKIYRLCFDGAHNIETLVDTNLGSVEGLAFDWVSKNLYFVDGERKSLEVIRADISNFGRMRRTLLSREILDNPRGIALHPYHGYLYITDWSESSPQVARALLDGRNFTTLFGAGVVGWPNGITIDFQTDRIFFADAKLDYIASADLEGRDMKKIIFNTDKVRQPFAVGVYKSTVYWDDWTVNQVMQADKEFGWGISPIANFTRTGLVDLKVYGHWSQQGTNKCANQTDCRYLCMGYPQNEYACLCPDGLKRRSVSATHEECLCPDNSPVDSRGTCKSLNSTCAPNFFKCNNGRCIPEKWVCDVDNDCGDNSDENQPRCGSHQCSPPYWQCRNGHCITPNFHCDHHPDCDDGSDEENCNYETCTSDSFTCDNGKCIHKRWRCDMEDDCRDGSDEVNCTSKPEPGCKSTEFMCTDKTCITESWQCDGDNDCADHSDETNCQTFTCASWQFPCVSNGTKCIFRAWQCDGEDDCGDGSDELGCVTTPTTTTVAPSPTEKTCSELVFECNNGHCIPFWWRCDNLDDCGDSSDEDGCPHQGSRGSTTTEAPKVTSETPACMKDQFQCSSGSCIWETWVCDQDNDCPNGEDEANCPQVQTCADLNEFQCRRSTGCIPKEFLCNGHVDCADGSDEESCSIATIPSDTCPAGYFMCDGGACFPLFKLCDHNYDCLDQSDEQNCTGHTDKIYSVTEILMKNRTNVSISVEWHVNQNNTAPRNLQYMVSLAKNMAPKDPLVWKNLTWTTNTSYEITNLEPYTNYVLKVYIKELNETTIYPPINSKEVQTEEGIPSPPEGVKVEREMEKIAITWNPPSQPNGPIMEYHVFFTPPNPPQELKRPGNSNRVLFTPDVIADNVSVWVTVGNGKYWSEPSKHVNFTGSTVDYEVKVNVVKNSSSSVTLKWDPVENVDGYIVSHNRPENAYLMGNVTINTTSSPIEVAGLAPGQHYLFWVRSYQGHYLGPETTVRVTTQGKKLLPVDSLQAVPAKEGTLVKVSWKEPPYKTQKVPWIYRIVWGKSANDLKHSVNLATTSNTTFVIEGLEACETYLLAVMVGKPLGIGPVAVEQVHTGVDRRNPLEPKHLQATIKNLTMTITWESSCPQTNINSGQYLLYIHEVNLNKTSKFKLSSKKTHPQSYSVHVHWGGQYSIRVGSDVPGAALSQPVTCNGPSIPPPFELTYNPINSSFFWRNSHSMPPEIAENYTYVLYVSKYSSMSEAEAYECSRPPLVLDSLSPEVLYFAEVALKDARGLFSPRSQFLRFEVPIAGNKLVISQGSAVGVGVSVFLVVVALVAVVGVLAVRHRRLARSIITFTNTHYDSSQGTTLITTDHNLDEDDDSPMIRGFSDDEPLVIA